MPEIAEVALMAEAIRQKSLGKALLGVEVLGGRYSRYPLERLGEFQAALPSIVTAVQTKGKRCWLELANGWIVIISFGMSGGIYYEPDAATLVAASQRSGKTISEAEYRKHFHLRFRCAPEGEGEGESENWYFGDPRQFGSVVLSPTREPLEALLGELGPDMLTGPPISDEAFIAAFRRFDRKNISAVLLDQKAVSGVGNYIRCEVLYSCGISPWAQVSDLSDANLVQLHQAIRSVAAAAYQGHGASLYTYKGTRQEKGHFQEALAVYGKSTDPLGRTVRHLSKGPAGRGVYYVPEQQIIGSPGGMLPPCHPPAGSSAPSMPKSVPLKSGSSMPSPGIIAPSIKPVVIKRYGTTITPSQEAASPVRLVTPKILWSGIKKELPEVASASENG